MARADDLIIYIRTDDRKLSGGLNKAEQKVNNFSRNLTGRLAGVLGGAFAVERLASYTAELAKLSGEAEGVRAAFKRIADDNTMKELQDATRGTVSELELMKRAVQASNFQIPVENLGELFRFATKRAQETGESVDYLVNSIVLGIGRKSPLILDNLGISAVRLRQELKGAGVELNTVQDIAAAVGRIAAEEMEKSGDIIETNAIKIQNLKAKWQDFKLELAESPQFNDYIGQELDLLSDHMEVLFSDNLTGYQKFLAFTDLTNNNMRYYAKVSREAAEQQERLNDAHKDAAKYDDNEYRNQQAEEQNRIYEKHIVTVTTVQQRIEDLNQQVAALQETFQDPNVNFEAAQQAYKDAEKLKKEIQQLQAILNFGRRVSAPERMQTNTNTPQIGASAPGLILAPETDKLEAYGAGFLEKYKAMLQELQDEVDELNLAFNFAVVDGIVGGLEAAINGASFGGIMSALLGPLAGIIEEEGKILIAAGLGIEAFKQALSTLNGIQAIAVGGLLIGAAQGLKALGNVGSTGGAGGSGFSGGYSSGPGNYNGATNRYETVKLEINGKLSADGDGLAYVFDQQQFNAQRTRANG